MKQVALSSLSPQLMVLGLGFIIFGPLMALAPRFMPGAIVYVALTVLPFIFKNRQALLAHLSTRGSLLVLITIAYSCLTAFWSPSPRAWATSLDMAYLTLCCFLLVTGISFIPQNMKRLYLLCFSLSLLAGFFVMTAEFLLDHPVHRWFEHLSKDDIISENVAKRTFALFSMLLWPLAAWLERVRGRVWSVAIVLGFLGFSLISTSRSASLGMIAGVAVMAAGYFVPHILRWIMMAMVVISLVVVVPAALTIPNLPPKTVDLLFSSAKNRLKIWDYTARHVKEAPLFGHGIDSSRGLKTTVGQDGLPYLKPGTHVISLHPHNVPLQLWLDFGLVGVVLWGALLLMLVRVTARLPFDMQAYALAAVTCGFIMLGTTFTPLQAWWASAHIATGMLFVLAAQSFSSKSGIKGTSAGGKG